MISGSLCLSLGCEEVMNVARLDIFLESFTLPAFHWGWDVASSLKTLG